ncbi:MAG TPA: multiheme c-type cytochrome, partial [Gemmataceae bacterium]|nr:multiheme c-type cytochrome [Gemmataceae bacterium]
MVPARYLVALMLGSIVAVFGLTRAEAPAVRVGQTPVDTVGYQLPKDIHFVGNLSCASAACHAASDAGGRPGSEYTTWAGGDPHFRAYQVLTEPRSRRMVELLHGNRPGKPTPAHKDARCLSCHAPESATAEHLAAHGVGCESCHGPAEKWLTAHYQDEFKSLTRREKTKRFGLYPTKDLAFRTTLCTSCHVGDANREVDHDLIAAGHPRLAFEYTGYHHNPEYKRHWSETGYGPDFDARAWEIGQVACARSATKLLAARASKADHLWPELSEFSCFACHKDLDSKAWNTVAKTSKLGSMEWGTWYFANFNGLNQPEPEAGARATE